MASQYKLSPFVYRTVMDGKTPLGRCPFFPKENGEKFEYSLVKERYKDVVDGVVELGYDISDVQGIQNRFGELMNECLELEKPYKTQLEHLVVNTVNEMFEVPIETVTLHCSIVGSVQPKKNVNVKPMLVNNKEFKYRDTKEIEACDKAITKRRFLDTLIMGGAYSMSVIEDYYIADLHRIDKNLISMYEEIDLLSHFLLFNVEPKITDKNPNLTGYVEVFLGSDKEKTEIFAQGMTFPILLHETIKGLMELFISKGLPNDRRLAKVVVGNADFLLAEPWDLRMGVKIWEIFAEKVDDAVLIPYFLSKLSQYGYKKFKEFVSEVLSYTERGDEMMEALLDRCNESYENNEDSPSMKKYDIDKNFINDEAIPRALAVGKVVD